MDLNLKFWYPMPTAKEEQLSHTQSAQRFDRKYVGLTDSL